MTNEFGRGLEQTCRQEWRHGTLKACATSGGRDAESLLRSVRVPNFRDEVFELNKAGE